MVTDRDVSGKQVRIPLAGLLSIFMVPSWASAAG